MAGINQPSSMPTNKVMAYTAGGIIGIFLMAWIGGDWRMAADNPFVIAGVPLVFGGIAAWFVRDRPNVRN